MPCIGRCTMHVSWAEPHSQKRLLGGLWVRVSRGAAASSACRQLAAHQGHAPESLHALARCHFRCVCTALIAPSCGLRVQLPCCACVFACRAACARGWPVGRYTHASLHLPTPSHVNACMHARTHATACGRALTHRRWGVPRWRWPAGGWLRPPAPGCAAAAARPSARPASRPCRCPTSRSPCAA